MIRRASVLVLLAATAALPFAFAQTPAPDKRTADEPAPATSSQPARLRDADARRCLEFPTNLQVIVCAEKYRPDRPRT